MRFPLLLLTPIALAVTLLTVAPAHAHMTADEVPSLAPLVKESAPAVVNIRTVGQLQEAPQHPFFDNPFFERFFGERERERPRRRQPRRSQAAGSGVIVDAERGYLLTNQHVIADAHEIAVTLTDGRQFEAEVVGADPGTDVALLKIEADSLSAMSLADSDALEVGDYVVAIGNPFGLGQTVTAGIVSAVGRSGLGIESYEDFIQTDAAINFGNSGGALMNLKGELVGINTAIFARAGGNIGIGFAIPINMARQIMEQLLTHGEIQRGRIGVQIMDLNPDLAEALGTAHQKGALVTQVIAGTPAEAAGLQPGDVVVEMNGEAVAGSSDLRNMVGMLRVGDSVGLTIVREGETITIDLAVGEIGEVALGAGSQIPQLEGAVFGPLDSSSPLYGKVKGVLVVTVEADTPAWNAGLREGDVIVSANRRPVETPDEIFMVVEETGLPILLNVRRGDGALFLLIR